MSQLLKNIQSTTENNNARNMFSVPGYPLGQNNNARKFPLFYVSCALIVGALLAYIYWGNHRKLEEALSVFPQSSDKPISIEPLTLSWDLPPEKSSDISNAEDIEANMIFSEVVVPEKDEEPIKTANKLPTSTRILKSYAEKIAQHINNRTQGTLNRKNTLAHLNAQAVSHLFSRSQAYRNKHIKHYARMDQMSEEELQHLNAVYQILQDLHIECVRIDGSASRVLANGCAYSKNSWISKSPRLKLINITPKELIFNDEYEQEYRKEITAND